MTRARQSVVSLAAAPAGEAVWQFQTGAGDVAI